VTQSTTPQETLSPVVKTQEKQAKVAPRKIAEAMEKGTTPQKISQSLAKKEKRSIVDGMNNKEILYRYSNKDNLNSDNIR
jgi:hypothetical protein